MEGEEEPERVFPRAPGFLFDVMAVAFYLGMMFFVIGAFERRFYHAWLPYVLYPLAALATAILYKAL